MTFEKIEKKEHEQNIMACHACARGHNSNYLIIIIIKSFEDTLVCVGLQRIVTVAFFAPFTNILTYLP